MKLDHVPSFFALLSWNQEAKNLYL